MPEPPPGEMFKRRYWPDGPPTRPLPEPDDWIRLPTCTRLRAPAIVAFLAPSGWFEIGWNGSWVKAFARQA